VGHVAQKALIQQTVDRMITERTCLAIYIEAQGGLGKTRLLEDCPTIIAEAFPEIRAPAMIDIYDYANHNTTRIEYQLVQGLQAEYPGQPFRLPEDQVRRFFDRYDTLYAHYTNDPSTSGSFALTQMFVRCWNALANYYPLVIRFDTLEKLFAQNTPPGALIGDEVGITSANMLLEWLEMVIPLMRHTLIMFCGRPIPNNPLVALLERLGVLVGGVQELQPLDNPVDISAYMDIDASKLDNEQIQPTAAGRTAQPDGVRGSADRDDPQPARAARPRAAHARLRVVRALVRAARHPARRPARDPRSAWDRAR